MTINLFEKGDGLRCLKEIYHLTDDEITRIEDNVFEYETPPLTRERIEEILSTIRTYPGESEEDILNVRNMLLDNRRKNRWPKEDAVNIFLEITGIKPDIYDVSKVKVRCKHICTCIDNGESIRKQGLVKLNELLEGDSVLSRFLGMNGIKVVPSEQKIIFNNMEELITANSVELGILFSKLYNDKGEVEVFISGSDEELIDYSTVYHYPEILCTLDQIYFQNTNKLGMGWSSKKTNTYMIQFDAYLDECVIHEMPSEKYDMDKYFELERFLSREYDVGSIPQCFWQNYWIIDACLKNSTNYIRSQVYAAIKKEVKLTADRLQMHEI